MFLTIDGLAQHTTPNENGTEIPAAEESRFLSNIRQLTYDGKRAGEGYFSEDGTALIFQSEREPDNPFYQIYLLDLLTGDTHRVSTGIGKTTCAFFRPGTDEVLYASTHHDVFAKAKQEEELQFRASGKRAAATAGITMKRWTSSRQTETEAISSNSQTRLAMMLKPHIRRMANGSFSVHCGMHILKVNSLLKT